MAAKMRGAGAEAAKMAARSYLLARTAIGVAAAAVVAVGFVFWQGREGRQKQAALERRVMSTPVETLEGGKVASAAPAVAVVASNVVMYLPEVFKVWDGQALQTDRGWYRVGDTCHHGWVQAVGRDGASIKGFRGERIWIVRYTGPVAGDADEAPQVDLLAQAKI